MPAHEIDDWHRCFIALEPDAATREVFSTMPVGRAQRRVSVDQLHLTLAFLGSVPPAQGERLAQALPGVVAPLPPLAIQGSEYWPNETHPRLVVVSFEESEPMTQFEARVRALVLAHGLPVDDHRAFRPHVTLARLSRDRRPASSIGTTDAKAALATTLDAPGGTSARVSARFDRLTLYSSTLARHGARYRAIATAPVSAS